MRYTGGTWFADNARRVHLGEFPWRVNDPFTYPYDFGDYWQHQVVEQQVLPPTALASQPVCVRGRRVWPPEEGSSKPGTSQAIGEAATNAVDQKRRALIRAGPYYGAQPGLGSVFLAAVPRLSALASGIPTDGRPAPLPHTS